MLLGRLASVRSVEQLPTEMAAASAILFEARHHLLNADAALRDPSEAAPPTLLLSKGGKINKPRTSSSSGVARHPEWSRRIVGPAGVGHGVAQHSPPQPTLLPPPAVDVAERARRVQRERILGE